MRCHRALPIALLATASVRVGAGFIADAALGLIAAVAAVCARVRRWRWCRRWRWRRGGCRRWHRRWRCSGTGCRLRRRRWRWARRRRGRAWRRLWCGEWRGRSGDGDDCRCRTHNINSVPDFGSIHGSEVGISFGGLLVPQIRYERFLQNSRCKVCQRDLHSRCRRSVSNRYHRVEGDGCNRKHTGPFHAFDEAAAPRHILDVHDDHFIHPHARL